MTAARQWLDDQGAYDAAVVYPLTDADACVVRSLRALLATGVPPRDEPPHLTLLYLGRVAGSQLLDVAAALAPLMWPLLDVRVSGVGVFTPPGRVVAYLGIEAGQELVAAHQRAYDACARQPWFAPGPWAGDRWRPHITIVERSDAFAVDDPHLQQAIGRMMPLRRAALVAQRLDPFVICDLTMETE